MRLPPREASDDEVRAWVRATVHAMDDTPRVSTWRYRALGMTMGDAMLGAPSHSRLSIKLPVGEARMVADAAKDRGLSRDVYVRRIVGTWLATFDNVDPESVPTLLLGGMIRP